jgi:hypothetical protein
VEQTWLMRSRRAAMLAPPVLLTLALTAGCSTDTTSGGGPAEPAATNPEATGQSTPADSPAAPVGTDWTT